MEILKTFKKCLVFVQTFVALLLEPGWSKKSDKEDRRHWGTGWYCGRVTNRGLMKQKKKHVLGERSINWVRGGSA